MNDLTGDDGAVLGPCTGGRGMTAGPWMSDDDLRKRMAASVPQQFRPKKESAPRRTPNLQAAVRQEICRMRRDGHTYVQIQTALMVSGRTITAVLRDEAAEKS